jgi:diacylglycerol kinase family enzyme
VAVRIGTAAGQAAGRGGPVAALRRWATSDSTRFSALIADGGDGTPSTAATAAVRQAVPFLSVPSGFGNLFARAFGHVPDVGRVVDLIEHGVRNGQLFLDQPRPGNVWLRQRR